MTMPSKRPALLGGAPAFRPALPFLKPDVPDSEALRAPLRTAFKTGMLTNSRFVSELEGEVARRLGVPYCVAVSSCTAGLMIVLRALNLKGEVILPSFTFHATGHAVLWNGLRPVFVECDEVTLNVDSEEVERAIGPRTAAILAVHLFGNPAAVTALERIARRHRLPLIFDAAHALGSRAGRSFIGRFGTAEVFSMTPTKPLVAGEGGLVTTRDKELARRVRVGRNYGDPGTYDCEFSGLSARMAEFNAILALKGLARLSSGTKRRQAIARRYRERLGKLTGISFQKVRSGNSSTFKDFSIQIDPDSFGLTRDEVARALEAEGIQTRKYFWPPLHRQKIFATDGVSRRTGLSKTERISERVLSLPIYPSLSREAVERVSKAMAGIQANAKAIRRALVERRTDGNSR